jgi:hypothetical protein
MQANSVFAAHTLLVYNCRTSHLSPLDLALSATYFPNTGFTYAIVYGCDDKITSQIIGRLRNAEDAMSHPMLLPGILAELKRARHLELVDDSLGKLLEGISKLKRVPDWENLYSQKDQPNDPVDMWLDVSGLRNMLENWKEQLSKMIAHVDELSNTKFKAEDLSKCSSDLDCSQESPSVVKSLRPIHEEEKSKERMRQTGARIRDRLEEIMCDYNEKIRECTMILGGMSLATQMVITS